MEKKTKISIVALLVVVLVHLIFYFASIEGTNNIGEIITWGFLIYCFVFLMSVFLGCLCMVICFQPFIKKVYLVIPCYIVFATVDWIHTEYLRNCPSSDGKHSDCDGTILPYVILCNIFSVVFVLFVKLADTLIIKHKKDE